MLVVLREALSNQSATFVKLPSLSGNTLRDEISRASPQVNAVELRNYRMRRQLNPEQRDQLVDQYHRGHPTYELARQFGIHRCTVVKHLQHAGVDTTSQLKMTPHVLEQARQLYADGNSLAAIGGQLGVDATTVHRALKKAGVKMRDTHGRPT